MSLGLPKEKQFELPPADSHVAVGYRIIDLGTQQIEWQGTKKRQHKILISWELDALMTEGENAGKPFTMHKRYTYTFDPKGALRPDLEAWRGRPFTEQEIEDFKLNKLLGAPCLMGIVHNKKDGKTYANISSIMKLPKGMTAKPLINPTVDFDLSDFDQTIYDSFSDGLKETIALSPEYAEATNKGKPHQDDVTGHTETRPSTSLDDEIPF
jgi:hypothetical protein